VAPCAERLVASEHDAWMLHTFYLLIAAADKWDTLI
jgi:hypothetical protein